MRSIGKIFSFSAAHHLPHHEGQCHGVHGHNYKLEVVVSGLPQQFGPAQGMIMDFGDLDEAVSSVMEMYDHTNLNDMFDNPTAENMIERIARDINGVLPYGVTLSLLRLWETEKCYAEWTAD